MKFAQVGRFVSDLLLLTVQEVACLHEFDKQKNAYLSSVIDKSQCDCF